MATSVNNSNNSVNNMNNESTTKVICQNCGAEVIIPNHEHHVSGMAIGKDSGLGTIILPTSNGNGNKPSLDEALSVIADTLGISPITSGSAPEDMIAELIGKIQDGGYVDVENIVRRWIPAQAIKMLNSPAGFHKTLMERGIDYSWKVLLHDLKRQMVMMEDGDFEGHKDRNRWYNRTVAYQMATDFVNKLEKLQGTYRIHRHKGRRYINLVCWMNNGKGIHLDELDKFNEELRGYCERINKAYNATQLFYAVRDFDDKRRAIKCHVDMCPVFVNAYKAAGAYYTIKDFIMFEGFRLKVDANGSTDFQVECYNEPKRRNFVEQRESLEVLERKANEVVCAGVGMYGYTLLGLMKDFLRYNHFGYQQTMEKWAAQSEKRRKMRKMTQNRRSRK